MSNVNTTTTVKFAAKSHEGIVNHLNRTVCNLIDLNLQTKQAHWNIQGPNFQPIHEALDQFSETYIEHTDTLAERILALGQPAEGRLSSISQHSELPEFPAGFVSDQTVLELLLDRIERVAQSSREAQQAVAENDAVTEDLFLALIHDLEKQAWMVRSHLHS